MTTPYEAFMAQEMEKQALDPLTAIGVTALGHVASNAIIKGRSAIGDSIRVGGRSFGPKQVARDAVHDALEGRIAHPTRRELSKLWLGPEVSAQEYSIPHAVVGHYVQRAGGDKVKAIQAMKSTLGTPEFGKGIQGYAPSEHLHEAIKALPDNPVAMGPARGGTVAYKPGTGAYKAQEAAGKVVAQVGTAATYAIDPHLPVLGLINKGKDLLNRYTPVGHMIAARQVGKGMTEGALKGPERFVKEMVASPGFVAARDAGAVIGRGIDKAAPAPVAADVKKRVSEVMQSPTRLSEVAQTTQRAVETVKAKGPSAAVQNATGFYKSLGPDAQQVVQQAGKAIGAQGVKAYQQPGVQKAVEDVYGAATKGYDTRSAAGESGATLGRNVAQDVLDATVNKHPKMPVALRIPTADEIAAARAGGTPLPHQATPGGAAGRGVGSPMGAVAPGVAAGAAVGAGYLAAHGQQTPRYQEQYDHDPYAKAASELEEVELHPAHPTTTEVFADAFNSLIENPRGTGISLGRFDRVPQPLRIRAERPGVPKVITTDEALYRIIASKNHQHHLAKKRSPAEREAWIQGYKDRWMGDGCFVLCDVDLGALRHRRFVVDEQKVAELMASEPRDDGNYPILHRWKGHGNHKHVVLDGNHRVEALLRKGEGKMKAYVHEDVAHELDRRRLAKAETVVAAHGEKVAALISRERLQAHADDMYRNRGPEYADMDQDAFGKRKWAELMHEQEPDIFPAPPALKAAVTIPDAEFKAEHDRLLDVLESPSHKDDKEEAARQKAELEKEAAPQPPMDLNAIFDSFSAPIVEVLRRATVNQPAEKRAFNVTVPVDIQERTPSPFPEDRPGHALTGLRANQAGNTELAEVLMSIRGHEGSSHANAAIATYIAGARLRGLIRR